VLLEVLQSGGAGKVDVLVLVRFCSLRFGAFNFDGPATPYPLWWRSGVSVLFGGGGLVFRCYSVVLVMVGIDWW
jgi:hypothetical protein